MRTIDTSDLNAASIEHLLPMTKRAVYNGLDSMLTREVFNVVYEQLDPERARVYQFERAMQGPALAMMLRGVLVDEGARQEFESKLITHENRVEYILNAIAESMWGKFLNPNSPKQLSAFFYDHLGMPVQFKNDRGKKKPTTNRDALEKLHDLFPPARPVINCILSLRDIRKKISVLRMGIHADGRFRCSFHVAGTETGRWSSSADVFGYGANGQNITHELREIFQSDPGMKLAYADLEQAESRFVAYEAEDENYIAACESGDLHTYCCRLIWADKEWTGELSKDKLLAETPYYRHFSHRDMSKRGGHLTNYKGKPFQMHKVLKLPLEVAEGFQLKYRTSFPGIPAFHRKIAGELSMKGELDTAFGRKRKFFGRLHDEATIREGIAYKPQSGVGDTLNLGLYNLWQNERALGIQCLMQIHDAVLFQFPEGQDDVILPKAQELMSIPVPIKGRVLRIPVEIKVGYNWANMKKWSGNGSTLAQTRPSKKSHYSLLDRVLS